MDTLTTIKTTITDSFSEFEQLYNKQVGLFSDLVSDKLSHRNLLGGKHLRPILTLLSAGLFSKANGKSIKIATALELLHNTTLIHDDVVDESPLRRGEEAMHTTEGNKIAVLAGDYLFSQVFKLLIQTGDMEVLQRVANLTEAMGAGELQQQYASKQRKSSLSVY